jgi:hypothetical protein
MKMFAFYDEATIETVSLIHSGDSVMLDIWYLAEGMCVFFCKVDGPSHIISARVVGRFIAFIFIPISRGAK